MTVVPVLRLPRIGRKLFYVTVTAHLADGTAAEPDSVRYALVPRNSQPHSATEWVDLPYSAGTAVLLAGPEADPAGADVVATPGSDLWVRVVDEPEVDTARVAFIAVD